MDINSYLRSIGGKEEFAEKCETSLGHLRNIGYGYRACDAALAVKIERHSGGAVTRRDLRPDDWHLIWPELVDMDAA